ncbi:ABC transporter substrate-binding protein [Telmatospirillum siberiense]|uniref:SsuA/THI5-like domain-containing protein n=1 Tax=Telmatospirillum siberiense TaxID=382514 RepID=A0A2N3PPM6_9PROT|nr:NrtA/SsuA/CpmA family ABC transporter substrate-binding protein [Telmatospirillum siberiense]PKU22346.1 hypothetical protein CWS72_21960 [Telmatospirillum siberiense]
MIFRHQLRRAISALIAALALSPLSIAPLHAEDIAIGEGLSIAWVPFFVADEKKLWDDQGLTAKSTLFASGRLVLDALTGGHVILGTAAETPVMFASVNNLPVRIVATMNRYECFDVVAAKDIRSIQDLKGRKIGYAQGTNSHYYLFKLLDKAGLKFSDVTAISLNPGDFVSSLSNGAIDAFIWTEPHQSQAAALPGGGFHVIRTPGLYNTYSSIIALQSTLDEKPELVVNALKALITADRVAKENPEEAIRIVAEKVKLDPAIARALWPNLHLDIDLDRQSLVAELENQARWASANNLVRPDAKLPDFNTVVVSGPLEAARLQLKAVQK